MGRKARLKSEHDVRPRLQSVAARPRPNWPILVLSLVGMALTAYLSWAASSGSGVQGCGIDSGCDTILSSRWATLLGVPTAAWGLLAYATLAAVAFIRRADWQWITSWTVSFVGVLYSVYLTTVSITLLGATCPYCLTSLAIMTALFVVATSQRPAGMPGLTWGRVLVRVVPAAAVVIGLLHLNYVGVLGRPPAVEDPITRALAVHLTQRGAKMYGAYWCPHCVEQKELFGESAKRLPYVECSSGGPGSPQTQACRAAGIAQYPTWIIDGQRIKEVLTPTRLAELTGFHPPAPRP
ncbi:MAG: vitamin K epoxide reductase family protein [Vicinamibacteraceae bacterium]